MNVLAPVKIADALQVLKNGSRIVTAMAACEPQILFENFGEYALTREDLSLYCANPSKPYPWFCDQRLLGKVKVNAMFLTAKVRNWYGHGLVDYVPQHLSQWVRNLLRDKPIDVFWGSCTPPDARGFVSLGPGACYEPELLRAARVVVLEINRNLPVTFGATHVPISAITHFVESHRELPAITASAPGDIDKRIAAYVEELIADGSTIQLGIGSIPNAIGEALLSKKDLGVHSEMINDTIMNLYLKGVVTGRRKTLWPGKIVASFAFGSLELYRFMDANPIVELQPSSLVNDPERIGRNHRMTSINSAVEIDLTGQVCSESVGHCELSGVGGAADTHIGAQRSVGGRGIIALHATAKKGERSKIVLELTPGAKISVSRNDVDTIVTEYGVATLVGRSVSERVRSMIAIAHPNFREILTQGAKSVGYL